MMLQVAANPPLWRDVAEIIALALLLVLQSLWQRRTGGKSFEAKLTSLGNDMRTAINANRDLAAADFADVRNGVAALDHKLDLWGERTTSIGKSVEGLHARELARLEADAQPTRRRRR